MTPFEAIPYVTTPLALVAFVIAIVARVYAAKLKQRVELIKAAPESDRASLVEHELETYTIRTDEDNLTRQQKFELIQTVILQRAYRLKILAVSAVVMSLGLASAIVVVSSLKGASQQESQRNGNGERSTSDEALTLRLQELEERLRTREIEDPHLIFLQDPEPRGLRRVVAGEPRNYGMADTRIDPETETVIKTIEGLTETGLVVSHVETFYRMGLYYQSNNSPRKAIDLYEKASNLRPEWFKPIIGKAICLEAIGEWENALATYRKADALCPDPNTRASVLLNLAATFMAQEQYNQAAITFERVLLLTGSESPFVPRVYAFAASAYREIGNVSKEKALLEKFLETTDESSHALEEVSAVKRRLDELKE